MNSFIPQKLLFPWNIQYSPECLLCHQMGSIGLVACCSCARQDLWTVRSRQHAAKCQAHTYTNMQASTRYNQDISVPPHTASLWNSYTYGHSNTDMKNITIKEEKENSKERWTGRGWKKKNGGEGVEDDSIWIHTSEGEDKTMDRGRDREWRGDGRTMGGCRQISRTSVSEGVWRSLNARSFQLSGW